MTPHEYLPAINHIEGASRILWKNAILPRQITATYFKLPSPSLPSTTRELCNSVTRGNLDPHRANLVH